MEQHAARLLGVIAIVSVIPVEAEASVQYMASWPWQWAQNLYVSQPGGAGELTVPGLLIAAVLVPPSPAAISSSTSASVLR